MHASKIKEEDIDIYAPLRQHSSIFLCSIHVDYILLYYLACSASAQHIIEQENTIDQCMYTSSFLDR
jgi:hypothetical protein